MKQNMYREMHSPFDDPAAETATATQEQPAGEEGAALANGPEGE